MQIIDIRSSNMSNLVLLNIVHTCEMKWNWWDVWVWIWPKSYPDLHTFKGLFLFAITQTIGTLKCGGRYIPTSFLHMIRLQQQQQDGEHRDLSCVFAVCRGFHANKGVGKETCVFFHCLKRKVNVKGRCLDGCLKMAIACAASVLYWLMCSTNQSTQPEVKAKTAF